MIKSTFNTSATVTDHKGLKSKKYSLFSEVPYMIKKGVMAFLCALKNLFKSSFCFLANQWVRDWLSDFAILDIFYHNK